MQLLLLLAAVARMADSQKLLAAALVGGGLCKGIPAQWHQTPTTATPRGAGDAGQQEMVLAQGSFAAAAAGGDLLWKLFNMII